MAPQAVVRLDELLTRDMSLLELGSGASTVWYGERCGRVVSVEPDPAWAERTARQVAHLPNVQMRQCALADVERTQEEFDVIIVDGTDTERHTRTDSVRAVRSRARQIVVLDDSDRPRYAPCDELLADWNCERYTGFKSTPFRPTETTIWLR
jgi:hypothetical protein